MNKLMSEVPVGVQFKFNNIMYTKIQDIRVSCCRVVNCRKNEDGTNDYVNPNTQVEVVNA
jgi:hypothetical protein